MLKVEFLSKYFHCVIWVSWSKLKNSQFFGYHCFSGGQKEFGQKIKESKKGRKEEGGRGERKEDVLN